MDAPQAGIEVEHHGSVAVVRVLERALSARSHRLAETLKELMDRRSLRVVIDLSSSRTVDENAPGMLFYHQRRLEEKGGCLVLASPCQHVRTALERSGPGKTLVICDELDSAIEHARAKRGSGRLEVVQT